MWFKKDKSKSEEPAAAGAEASVAPEPLKPSGLGRVPGLRFFLTLIVVCGLAIGGAVGMKKLDVGVQKGNFGPVVKYVGSVLEGRPPDWMPEKLGSQIAQSILPKDANYNDPELPGKVQSLAAANPWIRSIQHISRRMSKDSRIGLVTLSAQYRQPIARIKTDHGMVYVDKEGFCLPETQVPQFMYREGRNQPTYYIRAEDAPKGQAPYLEAIHYIEIEGVSTPPPAIGHKWDGDDLADGLKLVGLMYTRPYRNQIVTVDVRNYGGRINRSESFLRMVARIKQGPATDILFGQFPSSEKPVTDTSPVDAPAEIPSAIKLRYLDGYAKDHDGLLAGKNRYLDLRYDNLHVSND